MTLTTRRVALQIGRTPTALAAWLHRHPEHAPQKDPDSGRFCWSPDAVERVRRVLTKTNPENARG